MSDEDIGDDVAGDEQEEQANVSDAGQEGEEEEQAGDGDGAGEGEEEEEGDDVQVTDSSEVRTCCQLPGLVFACSRPLWGGLAHHCVAPLPAPCAVFESALDLRVDPLRVATGLLVWGGRRPVCCAHHAPVALQLPKSQGLRLRCVGAACV